MLVNKTWTRTVVLGMFFVALAMIGGCGDSGLPTGDNTTKPSPGEVAADTEQAVLSVTAPYKDITCAVGQPVLVTWEIQNLPATPTVDILYQASNESSTKTLLSGLSTSNIGSCQIDTFAFVPGLTYTIRVQLKSAGTLSATASASGRVIIATPELSVTTPSMDVNVLPSQVLQIGWSGKYLPVGSSIEAFFDFDTTYNSGNEVIVQTGTITTTGASITGSMVIAGSDLWTNAKLLRGVSYYLGLRIVKNGQTFLGAYAKAAVTLYGGKGFEILYPANDLTLRYGENFQVRWSTSGVPTALKVRTEFINRNDNTDNETLSPDVAVTAGSVNPLPYTLDVGKSYNVVLRLLDGQTTVAVRQATAIITIKKEGSTISVSNAELQSTTGKVYLGKGNSYAITWNGSQPPVNGTVRLFLDEDGIFPLNDDNLTDNRTVITKNYPEGIPYDNKTFTYTPNDSNFKRGDDTALNAGDYFVLIKLYANGIEVARAKSNGKIRIGEGGIDNITFRKASNLSDNYTTNLAVAVGDNISVKWDFTGNILAKFTSLLNLHLYASESGVYDNTAIPLSDNDSGVDVRTVDNTTVKSLPLAVGKSYYVIGRLFMDNNTEEETRVVSTGRISVQQSSIVVDKPATDADASDNLSNILVHWTINNLAPTGRLIRIYVGKTGLDNLTMLDGIDAAAVDNATITTAANLPPGTYTITCEVYEIGSDGNRIIRITGSAPGHIKIADGYNGTYDLAAMSAVQTTGYSPIDGTVFEGANKDDGLGWQLANMGDLNNDGNGDFVLFAQKGYAYSIGATGAGYLLYGSNSFESVINVNRVPDNISNSTLLAFPQENLGSSSGAPTTYTTGDFKAFGLPDMSNDGKGDLIVTCAAKPITFTIENTDPTGKATSVRDDFGRVFTVAAGKKTDTILSHALPTRMTFTPLNNGSPISGKDETLYFDADFKPGDLIGIVVDNATPDDNFHWTVTAQHTYNQYNTMYMITSQKLDSKQGVPYFLQEVGDPVKDNISDRDNRTQMVSWTTTNESFGFNISPLGNYDSASLGSNSEVVMVAPGTTIKNLGDPAFPDRANAGAGLILKNGEKDLFITGTGQGMDWLSALGDNSNDPSLPNPRIDLVGDASANLTNVIGLGKYSNPNSHRNFAGMFFGFSQSYYPTLVAYCKGENAGNGGLYVLYPDRQLNYLNIPQLDLKYFNATPPGNAARLKGIKINGEAGLAIENIYAIGDFDGDGLGDFVIAMPSYSTSKGRIMIVFGKANLSDSVSFNISALTSAASPATRPNALIFDGEANNDQFGNNVAVIGDVNGDGVDDILVSAPGADISGRSNCGKVYLIYGRPHSAPAYYLIKPSNTNTIADYDLNNAADGVWTADKIGSTLPGAVFVGENAGDQIQTVSAAGNADGDPDGCADFLIGAPTATARMLTNAGKAYLILGRLYVLPKPTP